MPETVCDGEPTAPSRAPVPHASWELPAEPATVGSIRAGVRDFARAHGLGAPHVADLALAVTEAVTNCVVHAFVGREPGTVRTAIQAGAGELVVTVVDDGRGMQPRADSPGLGLGLPTIASLTTSMDMHAPPGGGTALTMTFSAPTVHGPARTSAREAELLDQVARTVEGTWPGEGVDRLVDLLVPELADACALDAMDASGHPQRFAGRIDGPDGARQSAWLAGLKPRTDAPQSAARRRSTTAACTSPSSRTSTSPGSRSAHRTPSRWRPPACAGGSRSRWTPTAAGSGCSASACGPSAGPGERAAAALPRRRRSRRPRAAHHPADLGPRRTQSASRASWRCSARP